MTLAFICGSNGWGGLEMNHLNMAYRFHQRGYKIKIICPPQAPIHHYACQLGLEVHPMPPHGRYKYLRAAKHLAFLLNKLEINHLFVRRSQDLNIASLAKRKLKKPYKLYYFMEMQLGVSKRNWLHTRRFRQIDVWNCPLNYLKEQVLQLTRFPAERISVIPSAVDTSRLFTEKNQHEARQELNLPVDCFLLGLPGRIDPYKGQLLLLEALKACPEKVHVVLIGESTRDNTDQSYYNQVMQLADSYPQRIHLLPFSDKLALFYKAIDACVMASKSETFGMVTIEALCCGLPVIGSRSGGTPELLKHGELGLLFESGSAQDLALQINRLVSGEITFDAEKLKEASRVYDSAFIDDHVLDQLNLPRTIQ